MIFAIVAAVAALLVLAAFRWPRRAVAAQALPQRWPQRLHELLPFAAQLPAAQQALHLSRVEQFLRAKRYVGCAGLVVTDDMRLLIAGYACLLLLRADAQLFPAVRAILIYPSAFLVPHAEPDEFGLVSDEPVEQIGESWQGDRVVLSWEDVQAAAAGDEVNVVVHEFAHQLDDESPGVPGAPALRDYTRWSEVMQAEYARLRRHRRPPVLDPYGAESPEEFFGVVTEAFIQRGDELCRHHPQLYRLLADYYAFETAAFD